MKQPEIISQSPLEAIHYILRYQNDKGKIEVNESKMIIVGQGGVGKICLLNRLKNDKYDLKDEIVYENPELGKELEKVEQSVEKLNNAKTKDEIVKSGALNKVRRFLAEVQDAESDLGKVVSGIKYGVGIVQEIGEKYNNIAEWCGLPVIPKVFLNR